jgi:hypothetical protein
MLSSIFEAWADRGSTLSYDTFLGAVAQVLRDEGFDVTAVCNLFAAHEQNNQCPQYVIDVFGGPPPPGNPPPSFDRFAYALADQPANQAEYEPDTTYSHSGAGSTIKVLRTVAGHYTVTFSDLPASGPGMSASVAVTAFGSAPISCSAGDLSTVAGSAVVTVICWDHAQGMAADSRFSIMFVGNTGMPAPSAFLASGGDPLPPLDPERAWTSGWYAQSVTRAAAGSYRVNHGVGNALVSTKMITARGGLGGERCNMADLISAGEEVRCYDRFGTQVDGRFNAVQLAGGKPGRRFATALVYQASLPTSVGHPDASYSSAGGTITITRSSVGKYVVEFPGLQKEAGHTENVQVSALSTLPRTCNAVSMANSATGLQVGVECRQGVPFVDARFEIAVVRVARLPRRRAREAHRGERPGFREGVVELVGVVLADDVDRHAARQTDEVIRSGARHHLDVALHGPGGHGAPVLQDEAPAPAVEGAGEPFERHVARRAALGVPGVEHDALAWPSRSPRNCLSIDTFPKGGSVPTSGGTGDTFSSKDPRARAGLGISVATAGG